jgi:hypothetical protein
MSSSSSGGSSDSGSGTPITESPHRKRLPQTRNSITRKGACGAYEFYIILGFYDTDGNDLGEVFISIAKEGSLMGGLFDALATTISIALQHGVPWEVLRSHYLHTRFDPAGPALDGVTAYPSIVHAVATVIDEALSWRNSRWGTDENLTSSALDNRVPRQ